MRPESERDLQLVVIDSTDSSDHVAVVGDGKMQRFVIIKHRGAVERILPTHDDAEINQREFVDDARAVIEWHYYPVVEHEDYPERAEKHL